MMLRRFLKSEKGASMLEYAMIAALVAAVAVVAVRNIGQQANEAFTIVGNQMDAANQAACDGTDLAGCDTANDNNLAGNN